MTKVILHLGAHGTDEGLIATWLARNAATLARRGVLTMTAARFMALFSDAVAGVPVGPAVAAGDRSDGLMAAPGSGAGTQRVVASAPVLLGSAGDVLTTEGFYVRNLTRRVERLQALLPRDAELSLCLAVGSASLILPRLLTMAHGPADPTAEALIDSMIDTRGAPALPWADLVARLREQAPGARITVWRHEDLPQIWPQVLAVLAGPMLDLPVAGAGDFAMLGHTAEAQQRLRRYLAAKPPPTFALMRRVADAFAAGYGQGEVKPGHALQQMPPAIQFRLAQLDAGYDDELARIAAIDGVRVLGREPAGPV